MPRKNLGWFLFGHDLRFDFEQGGHLAKKYGYIAPCASLLYRDFSYTEYEPAVAAWLDNNISGYWSDIHWRYYDKRSDRFLIRFRSSEDLLLFKMKWL